MAFSSAGVTALTALLRSSPQILARSASTIEAGRPIVPSLSGWLCRSYSAETAPAAPAPTPQEIKDGYELRVASTSSPGKVAGFLLNVLKQDKQITAKATGTAVYNMVRAAAIANNMLKEGQQDDAFHTKRIAVRPVIEHLEGGQVVAYVINFHPTAIDWPADISGYKNMRLSAKSQPVAMRTALARSLIDEGIVAVNSAGPRVSSRAAIFITETCNRLHELLKSRFDSVIIPSLKQVENNDGTVLHLVHFLVVRTQTDVGGKAALHPKPVSDEELREAAPELNLDRTRFADFIGSSARKLDHSRTADKPASEQPSS